DKEYSSRVALMIKDNSKVDDSADRLSFTETLFVAHSILPDLTQTKTKENDCYLLFKKKCHIVHIKSRGILRYVTDAIVSQDLMVVAHV
ncbi:TPA: hypothetical protein ACHY0R_005285, partial [Escherichia coli]